MNGETLMLPIADGTVKLSGGDQVLRTSTLIRDSPGRGEEQGNLQGESDGSSSIPLRDPSWCDSEVRNDVGSISGNFIYRHHVEPRVKLYMPREESFPIPLRYIDVTRATSTTLDVMLERRIDDYWNIEGNRDLSDSWTGRTRGWSEILKQECKWILLTRAFVNFNDKLILIGSVGDGAPKACR